ncbi:MAG TPA: hypothetical protein VI911_08965 [Patescibacteria group bacterium]|nr:MAG: hypothetical protein UR43_C0005G0039 [candidate division TM6 bacterium GW2011_GWF2_33_332]HLD91128.1 hypothetical protein [Patescibacteria group bacterium]
MSYFDSNGLLNSIDNEDGGENSMLYTFEYILLFKLCYGFNCHEYLTFTEAMDKCELSKGVFKQHPTNIDSMSHDNLTSMVCYSKLFNKKYHKDIWDEIKRQGYFKYDNQTPDKPTKWLHPRDTIYYGILNNNVICYMFIPILFIMMLVSMFEEKESTCGKILWFIRIYSSNNLFFKLFFKPIYDIILRVQYGKNPLQQLFSIYFKEVNHPIHYLTRVYYER